GENWRSFFPFTSDYTRERSTGIKITNTRHYKLSSKMVVLRCSCVWVYYVVHLARTWVFLCCSFRTNGDGDGYYLSPRTWIGRATGCSCFYFSFCKTRITNPKSCKL